MSIEPHLLKSVGVYEEPAGSCGIDHSDTPADFLALPYEEGSLAIDGDQPHLDPMAGKIAMDAFSLQVLGAKKCTVALKTVLHSHGLDLDGATAAPTTSTWALLRVLKAIFGGSFARAAGGATTVQSATTTAVTVTTGRGADFAWGGVVACVVEDGSSAVELREIGSISGDVIVPKQAFSAPPVTGTPVRGGVTVHMTSDPDTSLQVRVEGRELSDRFVFCGLQGPITLELPFGQANALPKIGFNLAGTRWNRLSDGAAVPDAPSYDVFEPVRAVDAELTVPTVGSTTRVLVHQTDIKIELPGLAYEEVPSGAGVEGVKRKRRMPGRPLVRGSFTTTFEDGTWFDAFENRTSHAVFQQIGSLPGQAVLISVPTVQIGQPKPAAAGGAQGLMVPFVGRHDEGIDSTTDARMSAIRIHFV